jgi:hypothetical protein
LFALASCRIYSVENADGSFTIGLDSDSRGESANSLVALLSKSAGYTLDGDYESQPQPQVVEEPPAETRDLLSPHMEILRLIEIFLKFKGELASRMYAVVTDNYDLIRSVYMTVINKIGSLHSFTLVGIKILRKILEFATALMAQWQISLPPVSLDLNVGSDPQSSLHFTKNTNLYNRQ